MTEKDENGKAATYCSSWTTSYRYTFLAGTEVSALLGRMPSAVNQPTLAEEMGRLQERITSTQ